MNPGIKSDRGALLIRFILLLGAVSILLWACRLNQEEGGGDTLSFTALYDSLKVYDSVVILLKRPDGTGADTLFHGKVDRVAKIQNLRAPGFDGKSANILIAGFNAGKLEFAVEKKYDGVARNTENTKQIVAPGTTLSYDPTPLKLGEKDKHDLPIVTVSPESLFDKAMQWASSNEAVFTVEGGRIVAKGKGAATLTGTLKSDPSKTLAISVTVLAYESPVAGVKFRADSLRLYAGGAPESLLVTVTPEDANPGVDFFLSDSGKARIESTRILGTATGTLYVVVQSKADPGKKDTLAITVLPSQNTGTPVPAAPSIASLNASDGTISAVWSPVSGADTYNLYYAEGAAVDKGGSRMRNVVSPFSITGLKNGKQYAVALSAVNAAGESELSAVKTTTPRASAPGAPVLTGVAAGDKKTTVSWNAVAGAASYVLYYAAGTTVDKTGNKIAGAVSPSEVAGLGNGTLYAFAVSAMTEGGESELSNVLTGTPQVAVPGAPVIGSVAGSDAKATVSWGTVAGAASYNLYYAAGSSVDKTGNKIAGATSPYAVSGLANGTRYAFAVTAVTAGGESVLSTVVTGTPQASAPGAPQISGVAAGDKKAVVTWSPVTGAESYVLYYTAGVAVDKTGTKVAGVSSPSEISGLINGTQYAFAVAAVTAGGESDLSNTVTASPQVPIPGAPAIGSVAAGDGNAIVTWVAVADASSYNLYYAAGASVDKTGTKVAGAVSPRNIPGLANGTQYAFALSAVSPGGESALSPSVTATPQAAIPGAPAIGSVAAGDKKATVTWTAVAGAVSYALYYKAGTTVDKTGSRIPVTASPFEIPGLANGTGYAFAVSAITAGGESALSNVVTATPQVPLPAAPVIASAVGGDGKAAVAWGASAGASSYNIYYAAGTAVDKNAPRMAAAASPADVTGLTNGTSYAFAVSAVNAGGESGLSAVMTATPQVPAPGAPVLGSVAAGDGKATATWAPVAGAASYNLYYAAGSTVDKTGAKITGVSSPREITALTNCLKYAFAVSAVTAGGESGLSNVVSATPKAAVPVITAHPAAQGKCLGEGAAFSVTATGIGTLSYEWRKGNVAIAGATGSSYAISSVTAANAGEYSCAVSIGCSDVAVSNATTLTVNTPPVFSTNLTSPPVQYPGSLLTLTIAAAGTAPLTYQWRKGGVDIAGANSNSLSISNIFLSDNSAAYTCLVDNLCGSGTLSNAATLSVEAFSKISMGQDQYLVLSAQGKLFGGGYDSWGALGVGTGGGHNPKTPIMTDIKDMETGFKKSYFLKKDGTLWAAGLNQGGEFGDGTSLQRTTPVQVMNSTGGAFTNVSAVSANGYGHTLFIKGDGTVWAAGSNDAGQLGDGSGVQRRYPVQVLVSPGVPLTNAVAIATGFNHSLVLKSGGTVWAFGSNVFGQLGDGTEVDKGYATQVLTGVDKIAAGPNDSYCLKTDKTLWGAGEDYYGQFGSGTAGKKASFVQTLTGVADIAAGTAHLIFKKTDGEFWAVGMNNAGQLGVQGAGNTLVPKKMLLQGMTAISAGEEQSLFMQADGTIWHVGRIFTNSPSRLNF